MEPPDTQVTSSVLALLAYYKWFKFTIVYQDDGRWDTIAEHLITQAENRNFTINNSTSFKDSTACCVANPPLPCCNEVSVIPYYSVMKKILIIASITFLTCHREYSQNWLEILS